MSTTIAIGSLIVVLMLDAWGPPKLTPKIKILVVGIINGLLTLGFFATLTFTVYWASGLPFERNQAMANCMRFLAAVTVACAIVVVVYVHDAWLELENEKE